MDIANLLNSSDQIEQIVFAWAQQEKDNIRRAYRMKGAWEIWAQVTLALGVQTFWTQTQVLREQQVYQSTDQFADLVFFSTAQNFVQIIELKVDLVSGSPKLSTRWLKDVARVQQIAKAKYKKAFFAAVAICCTPQSSKEMDAAAATLTGGHTMGFLIDGNADTFLKIYTYSA